MLLAEVSKLLSALLDMISPGIVSKGIEMIRLAFTVAQPHKLMPIDFKFCFKTLFMRSASENQHSLSVSLIICLTSER